MKLILTLLAITAMLFSSCTKNEAIPQSINTINQEDANMLKNGRIICCFISTIRSLDALTGNIIWTADVGGQVIAETGPLVADGKVFVFTKVPVSYVFAFDLNTGTQLWRRQLKTNATSYYSANGAPCFKDGYVYVPGTLGIHKINASNGHQMWEFIDSSAHTYENWTSPVLINETVYSSLGEKRYALNAKNGKVIWVDSTLRAYSEGSMCVVDDKLYSTPGSDGIEAIDTSNNLLWDFTIEDPDNDMSPTSKNGLIFTSSYNSISTYYEKKVFALNSKNGKIKWQYTLSGYSSLFVDDNNNPFVTDKFLFVKLNDSLSNFNPKTGQRYWVIKSPGDTFMHEPVSYGNRVFISDHDFGICSFDVNTGRLIWSNADVSSYTPVLVPASGLPIHPTISGMTQ